MIWAMRSQEVRVLLLLVVGLQVNHLVLLSLDFFTPIRGEGNRTYFMDL